MWALLIYIFPVGSIKGGAMNMIVYRINSEGMACDLRFEPDNYEPEIDETIIAGDTLPNPVGLHSLDYLKYLISVDVKAEAAKRINDALPEWKARRHRDQVELAVTTTLASTDYTTKQQKCQEIRDASNKIEAEIQALTERQQIIDFDITNHPAWPV
jgi:hypothetical protein